MGKSSKTDFFIFFRLVLGPDFEGLKNRVFLLNFWIFHLLE